MTTAELPAPGRHSLPGSGEPATVTCGACGRTASRAAMTCDGARYLCGVETGDPELRPVYLHDIAECERRQAEARKAAREGGSAPGIPAGCGQCDYEGGGETVTERAADVAAHLEAVHGEGSADGAGDATGEPESAGPPAGAGDATETGLDCAEGRS